MKASDVMTLIRLGFEPAHYLKRSAWSKVKLVMEFLVNKGLVVRTTGEVKYSMPDGHRYTSSDLTKLVDAFMRSPFTDHLNELKVLSKNTGLPLKSAELLNSYMNNFNVE